MRYIKYLFVFSFLLLISFSVKAVDIPAEDDILVSDWGSSLVLDTDQTIKIVNIIHNGEDEIINYTTTSFFGGRRHFYLK